MLRLSRAIALLCLAALLAAQGCGQQNIPRKVIVLGIDGLDPQLLRRYMSAAEAAELCALAQTGGFRELGTGIPPQSPVAWSNLRADVLRRDGEDAERRHGLRLRYH